MAEESDGIEEVLEGQLRVAVTVAGHVGEALARAREEARRAAAAADERQARELASRLAAEQRAARVELAAVHQGEWWDRATPERIAHTHQVARAWANEDPEATRAEDRIRDELRSRYGVDVERTGADPAAVRAAVDRAMRGPGQGELERTRAAAEHLEAASLLGLAEREDQAAELARAAAEHEPDPIERGDAGVEIARREVSSERAHHDSSVAYDSAERRAATAAELEAAGIEPAVAATRMRADVSQAQPPTTAVKSRGVRTRRARRTRGREVQAKRDGMTR